MNGQTIIIWRGNLRAEGTVISAINNGDDGNPDWYVEYHMKDTGSYCYYKQGLDGGVVLFLDPVNKKMTLA